MKREDFNQLTYFRISEKNHKGNFIFNAETLKNTDIKSLLFLDRLRDFIKFPIIIHCTYQDGGHSKYSQHYKKPSSAVDFHIETKMPFIQQIKIVLAMIENLDFENITGLGIYPDWKHKGFHLDFRGSAARWGAMNTDGEQKYFSFNYILDKIINNEV